MSLVIPPCDELGFQLRVTLGERRGPYPRYKSESLPKRHKATVAKLLADHDEPPAKQ